MRCLALKQKGEWESLGYKQCTRQAVQGDRWCAIHRAQIDEARAKLAAMRESQMIRMSTWAVVRKGWTR
jgi:hypothetical protein